MDKLKRYLSRHHAGRKAIAFLVAYIAGCMLISFGGALLISLVDTIENGFVFKTLTDSLLLGFFAFLTSIVTGLGLGFIYFLVYLHQTDYSLKKRLLNLAASLGILLILVGLSGILFSPTSRWHMGIVIFACGLVYAPVIIILSWFSHRLIVASQIHD